jgi:hypothetical protein
MDVVPMSDSPLMSSEPSVGPGTSQNLFHRMKYQSLSSPVDLGYAWLPPEEKLLST